MGPPHPIDELIEQLDMTSMVNGVYDENRLTQDLQQLASTFAVDALEQSTVDELSQPLGLMDLPPRRLDTLFGQPLVARSASSSSSATSQSSATSDTERDITTRPRQTKMPWTREEDHI